MQWRDSRSTPKALKIPRGLVYIRSSKSTGYYCHISPDGSCKNSTMMYMWAVRSPYSPIDSQTPFEMPSLLTIRRSPSSQTGRSTSLAAAATASCSFADLRRGEPGSTRVTGHAGSLTCALAALLAHVAGRDGPCCHADLETFTGWAEDAAPSEPTCQCFANASLSPVLSILCQSHIRLNNILAGGRENPMLFKYCA